MWRWESGGLVFSSQEREKKGGGGGSNRGRSTRRARFAGFAGHEATRIHTTPHTRPSLSLSLAHFTLLVDEAHTNEQTRRRTCMPAMATGLRVALEATLRDWVGLATRAFLEDMIMEFMVSKLV